MPEEPEVETEKLHEAIHEELEKEGGAFLRNVALTTALLAALAAIASLQAGATVNEALVLKAEATRLQGAVQTAEAATWKALGKTPPPELEATAKRYGDEQAEIKTEAAKLEKERDEKSREADELMHRHHAFANAVALIQVAIALGAVAALTRMQLVWWGSVVLGTGGLVMFLLPLLR